MTARLAWLLILAVPPACSPMAVHLGTEKPLKVDIKMRMDVYQHDAKVAVRKQEARASEKPEVSRRLRMGEIQTLKNSRLVGENRAGLIEIRNQPVGEYGDYVKKTVEAENDDRRKLMESLAKEKGVSLEEIERRQADLFRQSAFPGEWYEEQDSKGGYAWTQKK